MKLAGLVKVVQGLLTDGFRPIVFCKYIPTAEYVAAEFRERLRGVEVACVTGQLPHDEREERVELLSKADKRVLVCTDCLSEGINLQEYFDAVVHADLAWSPTRHEQREGRVDRFNQTSKTVRVVTYFGEDNPVDGIVLQILLNKHKVIRSRTGVSVPVPVNTDKVMEAIFQALILRGIEDTSQLNFAEELALPDHKILDAEWDRAADRERRSRTLFAQHAIKPEEVQPELEAVRQAVGSASDLERFVRETVLASGGRTGEKDPFVVDLSEASLALRDAVRFDKPFSASFKLPAPRGAASLTRTHPFTEALASYVMDAALAGDPGAVARRCGVTATDAVRQLTTILLLRFRFQLVSGKHEMLAEDTAVAAFQGTPDAPIWLSEPDAETLLAAPPRGNVAPDQAKHFLRTILGKVDAIRPKLLEMGAERADGVLAAHRRVRKALEGAHAARSVRVQGEPDILGLYLLLPIA